MSRTPSSRTPLGVITPSFSPTHARAGAGLQVPGHCCRASESLALIQEDVGRFLQDSAPASALLQDDTKHEILAGSAEHLKRIVEEQQREIAALRAELCAEDATGVPAKRKRKDDETSVGVGESSDLKEALSEARKELAESRTSVADLQSAATKAEARNKELSIQLADCRQLALHRQEEQENSLCTLRNQRTFLLAEDEDHKAQATALREQLIRQTEAQAAQTASLELDCTSGAEKVTALEFQSASLQSELQRVKSDLETKNSCLSATEERLSQLKVAHDQALSDAQAVTRDALGRSHEVERLKLQLLGLENTVEAAASGNDRMEQLQREVRNNAENERKCAAAVEEARKLREEVKVSAVLQEEIQELKAKVLRSEEASMEFARTRASLEAATRTLKEWEGAVPEEVGRRGESGSLHPTDLVVVLQDYQAEIALLRAKMGEEGLKVSTVERSQKESQRNEQTLKVQLQTAQEESNQRQEALARTERRVVFLTKERDGLKSIVDLYNQEQERSDGGSGDTISAQRIAGLEKTLSDSQSQGMMLQAEVAEHAKVVEELQGEIGRLRDQAAASEASAAEVLELKGKVDALTKALETAEETAAGLEKRLAKGEFNPLRTKVLHFAQNPMTMAHAAKDGSELMNVKSENEILRAQLSQLSGENDTKAQELLATPLGGTEVTELKDTVTSLETRVQRLKEVFKSKTQEFREAVYLLTGYKVNMTSDGSKYALRSMYAEREDDFLLFQPKKAGPGVHDAITGMELLESDFATSLDAHVLDMLRVYHSIPAFLGCVTQELFNKQTFM